MKKSIDLKELFGKKRLLETIRKEYNLLEMELISERETFEIELKKIYKKYNFTDISKPYCLSLAIEIDKYRSPLVIKEEKFEKVKHYFDNLKENIEIEFNKILTNGYETNKDYDSSILNELKDFVIRKQNNVCPICEDIINCDDSVLSVNRNCQVMHNSCKNYINSFKTNSYSENNR